MGVCPFILFNLIVFLSKFLTHLAPLWRPFGSPLRSFGVPFAFLWLHLGHPLAPLLIFFGGFFVLKGARSGILNLGKPDI